MFEEDTDGCALRAKNNVKRRMRFDDNLTEAFAIWGQLKDLRKEIALGGKGLLVGLISARIGLYSQNAIALCDAVSELVGGDLHELVYDLLQEFDGPDPERHLWEKDETCTYRLHN